MELVTYTFSVINTASVQLVKKFPAFYGARKFITAVTSARHLSLSCASFCYVPEMYLQLSQTSFSSSTSVCVWQNKDKSTPVSKPCVMRAYVCHAYTFSTFHMQRHFGEVPKPWFAKCFWEFVCENLRKRYF